MSSYFPKDGHSATCEDNKVGNQFGAWRYSDQIVIVYCCISSARIIGHTVSYVNGCKSHSKNEQFTSYNVLVLRDWFLLIGFPSKFVLKLNVTVNNFCSYVGTEPLILGHYQ